MLNEDGFRTQISDSPVCDCGTDYESVEHFLLECKLYSEDRKVMFEDIKEVYYSPVKTPDMSKFQLGCYWVKAGKAASQLRYFDKTVSFSVSGGV